MATPHAKKIVMDLLSKTKAQTGQYGLPDVIAGTDSLLSKILTDPPYSAAEQAEWAAWLARIGTIPVLGEYRRDAAELPAVFVLREGDEEPARGGYLGDYLGDDEDESTDYTVGTKRGAKLHETLSVQIWAGGAEAPAIRDLLYLVVRELLIRARRYLHSAGMWAVEWTGGKDGQLERPEHNPHLVHMAQGTLTYWLDVAWIETDEIILDVDGHLEGYESGRVSVDSFTDER